MNPRGRVTIAKAAPGWRLALTLAFERFSEIRFRNFPKPIFRANVFAKNQVFIAGFFERCYLYKAIDWLSTSKCCV